MNLHHCVPTWNNLEDVGQVPTPPSTMSLPPPQPPPSLSRALPSQSHSTTLYSDPEASTLDYEMAELTWENGQLTMHGLGIPRTPSKSNLADTVGWTDKSFPRANGTLESVVNQAYKHHTQKSSTEFKGACEHDDDDKVPWFRPTTTTHVPVTLDALVPSNNMVGCSTRVGSCSEVARVPLGSDWSVSVSVSESMRRSNRHVDDTCEQLQSMDTNSNYYTTNNNGVTSTSIGASPENTKTFTVDDHDSASQSRPQRERDEEGENKKQARAKSNVSTKSSRAAAVHNQSERKRRDKINQRMKTLQKLVPNSNKADKASMLDEVIEYLKQLQAQVQMLSRMSVPSMMMPLALQHQLQMPMMAPLNMAMNMGMGMGMGMDHMNMNMNMNSIAGRPSVTGVQTPLMSMAPYNIALANCDGTSVGGGDCLLPQGTMVSTDPLSTYLACQAMPMTTMDAYSRMAAMYQQLQQQTLQQRQNLQQPDHSLPNN